MADPITTTVIVLGITKFLAEKALGKPVEKGFQLLWNKCETLLKGDPILSILPEAYDSPNKQKELETKLDEKFAQDLTAKQEFEEIYRTISQNIIQVTNSNIQSGKQNINVQSSPGTKIGNIQN
jgi:hypothetical protein